MPSDRSRRRELPPASTVCSASPSPSAHAGRGCWSCWSGGPCGRAVREMKFTTSSSPPSPCGQTPCSALAAHSSTSPAASAGRSAKRLEDGSGGAGSPLLCEEGTTTSGHLPSAESVRAMATTSPWHCRMRTSSQSPPARVSGVPSALRPFHPARLMYARSSVCAPPSSGSEASSYPPAAAVGTCLAGPSWRKPSPHSSRT